VRAGLFGAPEYLRRKGRPRSVRDLAEHECVLFRGVSGKARWDLIGPAGRETIDVHGAINADDNQFVREAAAAGRGVALLPMFACSGPFQCKELTRVLPDHATAGVPLNLVYPSARFLPKRVALLRDELVKDLRPRLDV
jgi:DNA-binding transcriptional LysR family regulator